MVGTDWSTLATNSSRISSDESTSMMMTETDEEKEEEDTEEDEEEDLLLDTGGVQLWAASSDGILRVWQLPSLWPTSVTEASVFSHPCSFCCAIQEEEKEEEQQQYRCKCCGAVVRRREIEQQQSFEQPLVRADGGKKTSTQFHYWTPEWFRGKPPGSSGTTTKGVTSMTLQKLCCNGSSYCRMCGSLYSSDSNSSSKRQFPLLFPSSLLTPASSSSRISCCRSSSWWWSWVCENQALCSSRQQALLSGFPDCRLGPGEAENAVEADREAAAALHSSSACFLTLLSEFVRLPSVSAAAAALLACWEAASLLSACFQRLLNAEVLLIPTTTSTHGGAACKSFEQLGRSSTTTRVAKKKGICAAEESNRKKTNKRHNHHTSCCCTSCCCEWEHAKKKRSEHSQKNPQLHCPSAKNSTKKKGCEANTKEERGYGDDEGGGDGAAGLPIVLARLGKDPAKPTVVFYSHYDVVGVNNNLAESTTPVWLTQSSSQSTKGITSARITASSAAAAGGADCDAQNNRNSRNSRNRLGGGGCTVVGAAEAKNNVVDSRDGVGSVPAQKTAETGGWRSDAWRLWGEDGYLYGRGVSDNKGPLLCTLFAVREYVKKQQQLLQFRQKRTSCSSRRKQQKKSEPVTGGASLFSTSAQQQQQLVRGGGGGETVEKKGMHSNSLVGSVVVGRRVNEAPFLSLPLNFVWIVEGQEEVGSPGFEAAVKRHLDWIIGSKFYIICVNSYWLDDVHPCLVYGMRGVVDVRVVVKCSTNSLGLHCGVHGGALVEPMHDLLHVLASLTNPHNGQIMISGFHDDVVPPSDDEIDNLQKIPLQTSAYSASIGHAALRSTDPLTLLRKRWLEPCLCILDISSSTAGEGLLSTSNTRNGLSFMHSKGTGYCCGGCLQEQKQTEKRASVTAAVKNRAPRGGDEGVVVGSGRGNVRVMPAAVWCDICMRLVPQQNPLKIFSLFEQHVKNVFSKLQSSNQVSVHLLGHGESWKTQKRDLHHARTLFSAAHQAVFEVWGREPLHILEGGSMPVLRFLVEELKLLLLRRMKAAAKKAITSCMQSQHQGEVPVAVLQLPLGQASDNAHLPNERIRVINLYKGIRVVQRTIELLAPN